MVELLQIVGTTPICLKVENRGLNAIEAQTQSATVSIICRTLVGRKVRKLHMLFEW
jgi:hypothetical protein